MDDPSLLARRLRDPAPLTAEALADLALSALDHGLFEPVVERLEAAVAQGSDTARLHQIIGLARREMLDAEGAMAAFERAAALAPGDALIAHGLARSTWEAGLPATSRYRQALRLAPTDAGILVGEASALVAEGRGGEALERMARLLDEHPGWLDGHAAFARLAAASRSTSPGTATVRAAMARHPQDPSLWRLLARLLLDSGRYAEALETARQAAALPGPGTEEWQLVEAIALSETGEPAAAQRLFDRLPPVPKAAAFIHPIRNLIRLKRFDQALDLALTTFPMPDEAVLWPYRALLWRLLGDDRWHWLEGDERLIGVYDLDLSGDDIDELADALRSVHRRSGLLPDQSVRGGTQTDGNLLARAEPTIRRLRDALIEASAFHVAQLPSPSAGHPTLVWRRSPIRIAGSWSVRLSDRGFHVDHVHPRGWFSSAFYVVLPEMRSDANDGWLAFGECRSLLPDFEGFRTVEPRPGRLVLFPSTMWHGTRPFEAGERMTVAFDLARP